MIRALSIHQNAVIASHCIAVVTKVNANIHVFGATKETEWF